MNLLCWVLIYLNSGHPVTTVFFYSLPCAVAWSTGACSVTVTRLCVNTAIRSSVQSHTEESSAADELASIFHEAQWAKAVKSKQHVSLRFPRLLLTLPVLTVQILLIALMCWDLLSWELCVSVRVCVCVFVVYMSSLFSLDSVKVKVELPASVHYCGTLLCFLLF